MRAADKTIAFVKEWIAGTYTKRQYQNYYIVKTPHAQFLMKQTEQRELLAVKDTTGHIYMFDNALNVYSYGDARLIPGDAMSNPFLCLIEEAYDFNYSRINPQSIHRMEKGSQFFDSVSKWKTLDRVEVPNPSLPKPVYLSLVAAGDLRLYIAPEFVIDDARAPSYIPLKDWATHKQEAAYKFPHQWVQYGMSELYSNKINSIEDIKGNYLAMAGDKLDASNVTSSGWVTIPTNFLTVEEITGRPFQDARATRPNPYAYGLVGAGINLQTLFRRYETIEENADSIGAILNIRDNYDSVNWEQIVRNGRVSELAESIIAYFKADDDWLREHFEVAKSIALEHKFRSKISMSLNGAVVYVNAEPNPTPMSEHVVYVKLPSLESTYFTKVLPTPTLATKVKGIFNDGY